MNHTPNYNLSQWEKSDKVLMDDFNGDNAKIDGALAGLAGQVAGKAAQSALDNLSQTVAGHTSALAGKGNCRIGTFSYTGTGKNGDGVTVSIYFPAKPVAFILIGPRCMLVADCASGYNSYAGYYNNPGYGSSFQGSGTSISWSGYTAQLAVSTELQELNLLNYSYKIIAFFAADA